MKIENLYNSEQNVPIIFGGGPNGLGLARSLGKEKVYSLITDTNKNYSFYSKYVAGITCPNPLNEKDFIEFLVHLGKKFKKKPVIFVTNDHWMIPISKNQKVLSDFYIYAMSDWKVINNCIDKKNMYFAAERAKLNIPRTLYLTDINDLDNEIEKVVYPCILKPSVTLEFAEKIKSKARVIRINTKSELLSWQKKISDAGFRNREIVIQEFIPGGIETLYTITTHSNKEAKVVSFSTGHKIRQRPPLAGTILSGKVIPEPRLLNPVSDLLSEVEFWGIANTEFKYDERDNTYKLIEINPRPGKWNYSVFSSGINMPYHLYKEALGQKPQYIGTSKVELIWLCFVEDFYNAVLGGFKKKGFPEFDVSIGKYLKSIRGKKIDAIFSFKDPKPGFKYLMKP